MIAAGEQLLGMNTFGWPFYAGPVRHPDRAAGDPNRTADGRSTLIGRIAGLLLCRRRPALRDVPGRAARHLPGVLDRLRRLLPDRRPGLARRRRRHATPGPTGRAPYRRPCAAAVPAHGGSLAGICFGLACGTKWSALWVLAGFGILVFGLGLRCPARVRRPAFAFVVGARRRHPGVLQHRARRRSSPTSRPGPAGCCTTTPTTRPHREHAVHDPRRWKEWATASEPVADGIDEVAQSLHSLSDYHQEVYAFHTGDYINAHHPPLRVAPAGWPMMARPVGFDASTTSSPVPGLQPTAGRSCRR